MKPSNPNTHTFKLELIWWQDAYVTTDNAPELNPNASHLTCSMGIRAKEDQEYIYLSHFYDGISTELAGPFTAIPRGMIKHTKSIEIGEVIPLMAVKANKAPKKLVKKMKSKKSC
jgi:hypothetical protein